MDRLETAFWFHKQFWGVFGPSARGLDAYAEQQVKEFRRCEASHGLRRCAFLFERLGAAQAAAFWHCNQIIRGLYLPFLEEWRAAFPQELIVVRVEDLLDRSVETGSRLQEFLGFSGAPGFRVHGRHSSYLASHAASLNVSCCGGGRGEAEPMLDATRALLEGFYQPYNARLAEVLHDESFGRWHSQVWRGSPWRFE